VELLRVPPKLERFVRTLRVYTVPVDAAPDPYKRLPDGETELLVRLHEREREGITTASVVGTRTHALEKPTTGRGHALLVRFRLGGAHPFLGLPLSELTDQIVALEDLWSPDLRQQLQAAEAPGQALTLLASLLERADVYDPASARAARRAVRLIAAAAELPRVPQLAAAVGLSQRQLRRAFDEAVGLSPKQYLRVARFRRTLRAARGSDHPDWAALADRGGYFDQPHLIAEFRALTGLTPAALIATTTGGGAQHRKALNSRVPPPPRAPRGARSARPASRGAS
jgi:AraC-like DNA-binding protein